MEEDLKIAIKAKSVSLATLCTGYGGLDMAVMAVFGGKLMWCADNDRHVTRIIAARYPGVPNLGDLTVLDWSNVAPVDILCAGFPCQDISSSGKRLGIEKGERSGIWKNIVEGIRYLRPSIIIVENVSAIRSRGLGRVLGDLASIGYDTVWTSVRASDVGAPHRRERVFILGYSQETKARELLTTAHTCSQRWAGGQSVAKRRAGGHQVDLSDLVISLYRENSQKQRYVLLPTPLASNGTKGSPKQKSSTGRPVLPSAMIELAADQSA